MNRSSKKQKCHWPLCDRFGFPGVATNPFPNLDFRLETRHLHGKYCVRLLPEIVICLSTQVLAVSNSASFRKFQSRVSWSYSLLKRPLVHDSNMTRTITATATNFHQQNATQTKIFTSFHQNRVRTSIKIA